MLENVDKLPIGLQVICWAILFIVAVFALAFFVALARGAALREEAELRAFREYEKLPKCDKDADGS